MAAEGADNQLNLGTSSAAGDRDGHDHVVFTRITTRQKVKCCQEDRGAGHALALLESRKVLAYCIGETPLQRSATGGTIL
jgi:hypothetical protein